MKRNFFIVLLFLMVFAVCVPNYSAQDATNETVNNQNNEVMGENDRLPFMQSDQNPQSQEPSSGGLMVKTLGAMILIVGLIFFGAWGARKLGFGNSGTNNSESGLAILSSVSLGNGRTISTVRFGERILVVGSTPQSFTLLAEEVSEEKLSFENSRSVAEMLAEENNSFAEEFEQAQMKFELFETKGGQI